MTHNQKHLCWLAPKISKKQPVLVTKRPTKFNTSNQTEIIRVCRHMLTKIIKTITLVAPTLHKNTAMTPIYSTGTPSSEAAGRTTGAYCRLSRYRSQSTGDSPRGSTISDGFPPSHPRRAVQSGRQFAAGSSISGGVVRSLTGAGRCGGRESGPRTPSADTGGDGLRAEELPQLPLAVSINTCYRRRLQPLTIVWAAEGADDICKDIQRNPTYSSITGRATSHPSSGVFSSRKNEAYA